MKYSELNGLKFVSTRDSRQNPKQWSFKQSVFQGLADDGGLFEPFGRPDLSQVIRGFTERSSFRHIARSVLGDLLADTFSAQDLERITSAAFRFSPKLVPYSENISILELFHGPSLAFKDFGASFLASCMEFFVGREAESAIILTATSGDTGSAVAEAFYGKQNIQVVILYPKGRISTRQEMHMTTLGGNIRALEVDGSFDDCQALVKEAFRSQELSHLPLTSANSINIGRLLPQSLYYMYAWAQLRERLGVEIFFVVPSGNFGNLCAGVYAWNWGLPIRGFIASTNKNDVVPQYLNSGVFEPRASLESHANAMDVGNPSNFERLSSVFNNSHSAMHSLIRGQAVSDSEILQTISNCYAQKALFVCPHTATGLLTAERFAESASSGSAQDAKTSPKTTGKTKQHYIVLATAHPAKFAEVLYLACGAVPPTPPAIAESLKKEKQSIAVSNSFSELASFLKGLRF